MESWQQGYTLPFTWSHSRAALFQECRRKYYWRYYAPYGGNSPWETGDRTLIRRLGRLTSVPMLIGACVHEVARAALSEARAGRSWAEGSYVASVRVQVADALRRSQKAVQRLEKGQRRGSRVLLEEHFYHRENPRPFGAAEEAAALERAAFYARALVAHPLFQEALAHPQTLWAIDEEATFLLDGVPVHAVPDVAQRLPDGTLRLIEWKTGASVAERLSTHAAQLAVYALYARIVWQVPAARLACVVADLHHSASLAVPLDEAALDQTAERIHASAAALRRPLRDAARNQAHADDFPLLVSPGTPYRAAPTACHRCPYRLACYGEQVWG